MPRYTTITKQICLWGHDTYKTGRNASGHCTLCDRRKSHLYNSRKPSVYRNLIFSAKKRGFAMMLTYEEFLKINSLPCHYCGGSLPTHGYGIDRKNNEPYYSTENSLPCCGLCNETKSNKLTYDEMCLIIDFRKDPNKYNLNQGANSCQL